MTSAHQGHLAVTRDIISDELCHVIVGVGVANGSQKCRQKQNIRQQKQQQQQQSVLLFVKPSLEVMTKFLRAEQTLDIRSKRRI